MHCQQDHDAQAEAEAKRQARLVRLRRKLAWVEQCIVDLDLAIQRKDGEEAAAAAAQTREAIPTAALQLRSTSEAAVTPSIDAAEHRPIHQPSQQMELSDLTAILPTSDTSSAPPLSLPTDPCTDGGLLSAQTQSRSQRWRRGGTQGYLR